MRGTADFDVHRSVLMSHKKLRCRVSGLADTGLKPGLQAFKFRSLSRKPH